MKALLVLHGPNLNLLGQREPGIYGSKSLAEINETLIQEGKKLGLEVRCAQSNSEGELISHLHDAQNWAVGVVFNPGGYSHTSIALRDAIAAIQIPVIEVHISNIFSREDFRHVSITAPASSGQISGFGWQSYLLALYAFEAEIPSHY